MFKLKSKFNTYEIDKVGKRFVGKFKKKSIDNLYSGELIVKLKYSSINQKDYLVTRGLFWGCRNYPLTPGIDGSGVVVLSKSKKFKKGDRVIIVASDVGSKNPGCYAEYVKIKDFWVNKLPKNLSLKNSMIFGTAGLTAMYIVKQITKRQNFKKSIIITGASGGVGLISTYILSKMGYEVTAVTRKNSKILYKIGTKKVLSYSDLKDNYGMPLQRKLFDICIDNVGGNSINYILKRLSNQGSLYSVGYVKGKSLATIDLTPFILRRVRINGVHTESLNTKERFKIWKFITKFIQSYGIKKNIYKEIKINRLKESLKNFIKINKKGRILIKI